MFNVLIVDDEKSNREGMRVIIDWEDYGFKVCATAGNGVDALEIIHREKVDLVITDIKMPVMNGIELLRQVREEGNDKIAFIILSGYAEFDYVKKAMTLGIKDYLIKPVEEEELCTLLEALRDKLVEEQKQNQLQKWVKLESLLAGQQQEAEAIKDCFPEGIYYYMVIRLEAVLEEEAVCQWITEEIGEENKEAIKRLKEKEYALIVGPNNLHQYEGDVMKLAQELHTVIHRQSKGKVSILIGAPANGIMALPQSKDTIEACRLHLFYENPNAIIDYEKIKEIEPVSGFKHECYTEQLYQEIKNNNRQGIEDEIYQLCRAFKQEILDIGSVKALVHYIIISVLKEMKQQGEHPEEILERYRNLTRIDTEVTIHNVQEELTAFCLLVSELIAQENKRRNRGVMGEILDYVDRNYTENLSLKLIANKYYLNASYLGQLFKKTTGVSFTNYLQRIRIRESKVLLKTSNMKIYEVAHQVGYEDPNYFVIKFEELEGVSPTTYRKSEQYG